MAMKSVSVFPRFFPVTKHIGYFRGFGTATGVTMITIILISSHHYLRLYAVAIACSKLMPSRRSSPHSEQGVVPVAAGSAADDANADWSQEDEKILIAFLLDHKASAGDGGTFKKPTWIAAAAHMAQSHTKGGPKTWESCKGKWDRVR